MINDLFIAAKTIQDYLQQNGRKFCFIGGLALLRWGEVRMTNDVDLTVICPWGQEELLIDEIYANCSKRFPEAKAFAMENRVILANSHHQHVPIDIAIGALPFEEKCVSRASFYEYTQGIELMTCSAEDLLITKTFAGRSRDWADIESIVQQQQALNWLLIEEELTPLLALKETPENYQKLLHIKHTFSK